MRMLNQRCLVALLLAIGFPGLDRVGPAAESGYLQEVEGWRRDREARLKAEPRAGFLGIAHSRWATHGGVTEANAHPHVSGGRIALIHNGIIENYLELREAQVARGYAFSSETDTEVIAHLVHDFVKQGLDLTAAVQQAVRQLDGAYEELSLLHDSVTDQGLDHLKGLTRLRSLALPGSITDEGVAKFARLTELRELSLTSGASDRALATLKNFAKLERLHLFGPNYTDQGLAHLSGLTELRDLSVFQTGVTGAGLAHLKGCTRLKALNLAFCPITGEELACPNCCPLNRKQ